MVISLLKNISGDVVGKCDEYGVILAGEGLDGGDTLANEGTYWLLEGLSLADKSYRLISFPTVVKLLEPKKDGRYRRHPDRKSWYGDMDRASRDQLTSWLAALTAQGDTAAARRLFWAHALRGFLFCQNTRRNGTTRENHNEPYKISGGRIVRRDYSWKLPDFTGPEFWALLIRATRFKCLYPLLFLFDLFLIPGAIVSCFKQETDVRNAIQLHVVSRRFMPTLWSLIAGKIFKRSGAGTAAVKWFNSVNEPRFGEILNNITKEL